ncbi:MAG: TIGR00269 family protein [Methanoregulaceae archaeon]|nr:TIGR00269 family protein [Methanoregulaceae archaeon]
MAEKKFCSVCGADAVTLLGNGRYLCGEHYSSAILERVQRTVGENGMIGENDHIAVALSGGKDSTVLLWLLSKILSGQDDITLTALTIDEGVCGYRDETIQAARSITGMLGISHRIVSFEEYYGRTLDSLVAGNENRACTICGVLRKKLMQVASRETGATKLATGHNLDDEAQSVLMNFFNGDIRRITRQATVNPGFIPRIKPLNEIADKEVALFGMVNGIYRDLPECPYARGSLRADVRGFLSRAEYLCPGTKDRIVNGYARLRSSLHGNVPVSHYRTCGICGEPCTGDLCMACRILDSLA